MLGDFDFTDDHDPDPGINTDTGTADDEAVAADAPEPAATEPEPAGYDPGAAVVGDPETSATYWHRQDADFSCAVAAQEFVLDEVTGTDRTEAELAVLAEERGWYQPGAGTPLADMANLLEHHGIPVRREEGANLDDVRFALADGDKLLVPVDADEIAAPFHTPASPLADYPTIPGQGPDHAVQVTGLDYTDPAGTWVILNDPGRPDGAGYRVPVEAFWAAWEDSGRYLVRAEGERTVE
ncbi:hypothetical protein [Streptomyces sp. URMC 129]|uniref:hypothetical protein n=1 Tax=Streptomyces sp. URMC 129 TaxID=3423407 RepID=UPI003F1C26C1